MTGYPIAAALDGAGRHCATLARLKVSEALERGFLPTPEEPTATVTFIVFEGRTYAVTAGHVIEAFRDLSGTDTHEGYYVPAGKGVAIVGPFIKPPSPSVLGMGAKVDVVICPVDALLPERVGKVPFVIRPEDDAPWPLTHALAVGYPTTAKSDVPEPGGLRLGMRCVHALSLSVGGSAESDQVQFYAEMADKPDQSSLSGMSGGPVFWSTEEGYGLLGFVKEALDVVPVPGEDTIYSEPRVSFICSRVDHSILTDWFHHVDRHWQAARDRLNAASIAADA